MKKVAYINWVRIIDFFCEEEAINKFLEHYNNFLDGNFKELYEKKQKEEFKRIIANGGTVEIIYPKKRKTNSFSFSFA